MVLADGREYRSPPGLHRGLRRPREARDRRKGRPLATRRSRRSSAPPTGSSASPTCATSSGSPPADRRARTRRVAPAGRLVGRAEIPWAMAVAARDPSQVDERFEALVLDFLAYMEFERGLARNTLTAYRTDLLQYGEFLHRHGLGPAEAKPADVSEFLAELATEAGCSAATINRKAACLRSFYRHLRRQGVLRGPDREPHGAAARPEAAPGAEPRRGEEAARGGERGGPDRAPRPRPARGDVRVRACAPRRRPGSRSPTPTCAVASSARTGKGSKERIVPLGREAAGALRRYLQPRPAGAGRYERRAQALRQLPRRAAHPPGALQDHPPPRPRRAGSRGR